MILTEEIVESVMRPIDGDFAPVGPDGRNAADAILAEEFRRLKRERKGIGRAERGTPAAEPGKTPPDIAGRWVGLGEDAARYVSERSKDLEILTIMVEASIRVEGLAGFAAALALQRRFVETFWELGMFPPEDEEGAAARFHPLSALSGGGLQGDGTLIAPLRQTPLVGSLVYVDKLAADAKFQGAQSDELNVEAKAGLQHAADAAFDRFGALASGIDNASAQVAIDTLTRAEQDWRGTIDFVVQRTKPLLPAASSLTRDLVAMREWLTGLFGERLAGAKATGAAGTEAPVGPAPGAAPAASPRPEGPGATASRENALITMLAIADFFEKTEPLSPIGPALRSLHRRAKLSFDDLVAELLPESVSRDGFYTRLGIKPPASVE